jgi:protein-S-isoprenylcysteine O-methyltransferase Ste14
MFVKEDIMFIPFFYDLLSTTPQSLVSIGWIAVGLLLLVWALGTKREAYKETLASRLPHLVAMAVCFALIFDRSLPLGAMNRVWLGVSPWMVTAALIFCLGGWAVMIWARAVLGGNWSAAVMLKQGHELVRRGPYAVVRHPLYTGMVMALAGTALIDGRIRSAVGVIVMTGLLKLKSEDEERWMRHAFGVEYDRYCQATGALIPRLR